MHEPFLIIGHFPFNERIPLVSILILVQSFLPLFYDLVRLAAP